ncbi:hypothetical protein FPQ18DRAFT_25544 [Pyronema domesticum]|nr:hypothetical protein FPQ18DRAFT_25544 [Pyronema domesticum]
MISGVVLLVWLLVVAGMVWHGGGGGGVGSWMLAAASIFFLSLLSYSRGLCLSYQWCFSRLRTMSLICSWGWLGCWLVVWEGGGSVE